MTKWMVLICIAALCCFAVCCSSPQSSESKPIFPDLGQAQSIEPGVILHEVYLPREGTASKLWVYLPAVQSQTKIPCVIIAPAGTRLFHGSNLGESDRPEHLPYVRAGFAVIAYELDGPLAEDKSDEALLLAAQLFEKAEAGLVNARVALDYALAKVPQIDSSRIFTAGHSSAGTVSLLVAEREPRVRACIAYAPVTNVEKFLGEGVVASFSTVMPDYREFLKRTSPHAGAQNLSCPLFLFHAKDDGNVDIGESEEFANKVRRNNAAVTFVRTAEGGHYNAMLNEGVPKAIEWLKALK